MAKLAPFVPEDVTGHRGLSYGPGAAERLDVWYPRGTERALPTVVWVHGGGWVAGSNADVEPYAKILAAEGYTVVAVDYALAPGSRYPMPLRQVNAALGWLDAHADRLPVDKERLVLAGDSAGAQIAAQLAAAITDPAYAEALSLEPAVTARELRGVVSHCGPQRPVLLEDARGVSGWFVRTVGRAYFNTESFDAPHVREASVADHVTRSYPPALITGGNADPLTPQGKALAERLEDLGTDVTAMFWPDDYEPALSHEFQFDLTLDAAQQVLRASCDFLARVTR